jgi:curved DNA-binding protein CbpA
MADEETPVDYYELLQLSTNAEPETISRTYRLLAQRFHPDNQTTGNEARFRELHQAYTVLSDPEQRARYDIAYHRQKQDRWRLVSAGDQSEDEFAFEQMFRLTLLEALYTKRRTDGGSPSLYPTELESMLGRPREHLEFTVWYLLQKKFVVRDDQSRLVITADGVDYLEENYRVNLNRRRLTATDETNVKP